MPFQTKLTPEDNHLITTLATSGHGYTQISHALGGKVSKQRVKQICIRKGIDAFKIKQEKLQKEHEERMVAKWGTDWDNKEHRKSFVYQSMREKFRRKAANAKRLGIEFTIDFGDIEFPEYCPALGLKLNYFNESVADNSPSFDRIDPTKGYVKGNVVVISKRANTIKSNATPAELKRIANFVCSLALPKSASGQSHVSY